MRKLRQLSAVLVLTLAFATFFDSSWHARGLSKIRASERATATADRQCVPAQPAPGSETATSSKASIPASGVTN